MLFFTCILHRSNPKLWLGFVFFFFNYMLHLSIITLIEVIFDITTYFLPSELFPKQSFTFRSHKKPDKIRWYQSNDQNQKLTSFSTLLVSIVIKNVIAQLSQVLLAFPIKRAQDINTCNLPMAVTHRGHCGVESGWKHSKASHHLLHFL